MKTMMNHLAKLQALEFDQGSGRKHAQPIAELRSHIPDAILGHYDRLMARGKKGVVPMRNQNCTGCHMRVPLAVVMTLRHADDVQLCENCGRYLYLPEEEDVPAPPPKSKPRRTAAKRAPRTTARKPRSSSVADP